MSSAGFIPRRPKSHPSRLLLQHLHSLRQDQFAVHALRGKETDLTCGGEQLVEALERTTLSVRDPVIRIIAESDGLGACRGRRHICRRADGLAENEVGFTGAESRLPQILTGAVLELADSLDGRIVHHPDRTFSVRRAQRVVQVDQIVARDRRGAVRGRAQLCAADVRENAQRFADAVAEEECLFLFGADAACKFARDVAFEIEHAVVEQLFGNLDERTQLVGADRQLWSLLLSSGLIFFAFYFLLGAAFQKNRELTALAFCCAVIALRNQFFFDEHLLAAGYDMFLLYRFVILDVSCIPFSSLYLVAAFFPQVRGKRCRTTLALTAVFAVLTVCHFLVGTKALPLLCQICFFVCAPFLGLFMYRLVRHFKKERITPLDALTLAALALLIVMLIWEGLHTGSNSAVNHFGVTPLAMVVCILLLNVVINTRIQTQAVLLQETQQRNELLGQVNEMNRDFLRTVAHELKTPLTVISGYAQLMTRQMEKGALADTAPQRLETIRQESDRLAEIVTRLMDYTFGNSRDAELAAVDVSALFESAGAVLRPVCDKRGNTLTFRDDSRGRVHGNFELLLQVLINLVVNASRQTENGTIAVEAADDGKSVVFRVRDNGAGVAPDAVPHIFEKGFTTTNGQGLGLAICSETVALHGGTMELESTGAEGSCFRFTIPKEAGK